MRQLIWPSCVFAAALLAFPSAFASADDVVTAELDMYARENGLPAGNFSSPGQKPPRPQHEFSWGVERYSYLYREFIDGNEFVQFKGDYSGLVFSYTFRPLDVDSFAEIIDNLYRIELRYAMGLVDYRGSGTWDGIRDRMYELRGIAGHEISVGTDLQVMPYVGLGYRYLNNGFEEIPPRVVDGRPYFSAYNRESKYVYLPFGVELYQELPEGWGWGCSLEYDYWISGEQVSHFEDMEDSLGVSPGWDPMTNRQDKGYGVRGSLKIDKTFSGMKLGIEPYYRYWKVRDSEVKDVTIGGEPQPTSLLEPQNTTQEIGLKVGLSF